MNSTFMENKVYNIWELFNSNKKLTDKSVSEIEIIVLIVDSKLCWKSHINYTQSTNLNFSLIPPASIVRHSGWIWLVSAQKPNYKAIPVCAMLQSSRSNFLAQDINCSVGAADATALLAFI